MVVKKGVVPNNKMKIVKQKTKKKIAALPTEKGYPGDAATEMAIHNQKPGVKGKRSKAKGKDLSLLRNNLSGHNSPKQNGGSDSKLHKKGKRSKNWIQGAIKKPGALHSELGVPQGKKIPPAKLAAAAKKGGKEGARARLAETLKGLHKNQSKSQSAKAKTAGQKAYLKRVGTKGMGGKC